MVIHLFHRWSGIEVWIDRFKHFPLRSHPGAPESVGTRTEKCSDWRERQRGSARSCRLNRTKKTLLFEDYWFNDLTWDSTIEQRSVMKCWNPLRRTAGFSIGLRSEMFSNIFLCSLSSVGFAWQRGSEMIYGSRSPRPTPPESFFFFVISFSIPVFNDLGHKGHVFLDLWPCVVRSEWERWWLCW